MQGEGQQQRDPPAGEVFPRQLWSSVAAAGRAECRAERGRCVAFRLGAAVRRSRRYKKPESGGRAH